MGCCGAESDNKVDTLPKKYRIDWNDDFYEFWTANSRNDVFQPIFMNKTSKVQSKKDGPVPI